jgi:hypothetical protein
MLAGPGGGWWFASSPVRLPQLNVYVLVISDFSLALGMAKMSLANYSKCEQNS